MIIACEECQTKFSLEEGLLKETGSKVRCSNCKHVFTAFPLKEEPQIEEAPTEKMGETAVIQPEEVPKEEDQVSDFADSISEEIEEELSKEEEGLEPISFEELSQLDSDVIKKKAEEAEIDKEARVEEEISAPEELEREEVEEEEELFKPEPVIRKGRRADISPWITISVVILLLAGAAFALFKFKPDLLSEYIPFFKRPLSKEQAFDMGNRRLAFSDLNGTFVDSEKAAKLFVVKGLVTNNYPDRRSFIRIKSNILDSKGTVVKSKIVFAGNPISDKEILSLSTEEIDNRLKDKLGKDKMNINIQPDSSIPFMIIFSDLPEDMSEFTVEAISSSPAGK
ncbi:MAG: zinc-ribbon domain-containing protein [Deltaproteobacteria bacterium]|nr:MAG: zinc-ribbon domain-containing protein [Deltaproteobacteria bacterium]